MARAAPRGARAALAVLALGAAAVADRQVVKVPGWPELKGFPLSFGIKAEGVVYASGMQGMDMKTMKLVPGGVAAETTQTLTLLGELLQAAGARMEDVLTCSVSLLDIARDFKAMNAAYVKFWPSDPPARVAVQVPRLAGNASVEIQCNAALPGQGRAAVKVPGFPSLPGMPLSFATKAGGMVYLSGAQGMDMKTFKLVPGGVAAETRQTLANIDAVLRAAGSSPERVVSCDVSLRNISDFTAMNEAYKNFWPAKSPMGGLPSRVCVEVGAMAGPAAVEIKCTAAGPDQPAGEGPRAVKVPGWPDMPNFPFSAATTAGRVAFLSGSQGFDMRTGKRAGGGAGPETTQTLLNIQEAAHAAGAGLRDVVACEVSLADISDFAAMNKAYAAFWPHDPPSRVAVQVGALARGAAVEIKCTAVIPHRQAVAETTLVV